MYVPRSKKGLTICLHSVNRSKNEKNLHKKREVNYIQQHSSSIRKNVSNLYFIITFHSSRTSAVSSTNLGSKLIFACCVVGTCNIPRMGVS